MQKNNKSADILHLQGDVYIAIWHYTPKKNSWTDFKIFSLMCDSDIAFRVYVGLKPPKKSFKKEICRVEGQPQTEPNIYMTMGWCRVQAHTL